MEITYLQVFLVVALPIMGLFYALLGSIKLSLAEQLNLDEGKVGGLVSGFGMMVGPIILACGFLSDELGRMPIWIFGSVATAVAVFVLATTRSYAGALIGVCILGAGWAATVNVGNPLMRISVFDPDKLLAAVNFYDFIFGFGAFMAPIVVGFLLKRMGFRSGMIVIGVVATVSVIMGAFANMSPASEVPADLKVTATTETQVDLAWADHSERENGFIILRAEEAGGPWAEVGTVDADVKSYSDKGLTAGKEYHYRVRMFIGEQKSGYSNVVSLKAGTLPEIPKLAEKTAEPEASAFSLLMGSKLFWLTSLAFLFYVPLESCTAGWATTLIVGQSPAGEEEKTKKIAAWGLSAFWLCFMGSRLVVSLVGEEALTAAFGEHKEYSMLLYGAVACVALMILVVFMRGRGLAFGVVVLAGLIFGPVFPAMMTLVLSGVPAEAMGRAVGFFFLFGSVGWTVIPMLIGGVAKKSSIQRGFMVAAASSVVFLILAIARGAE